eukprot:10124936-Ditylum_brightwellii.AAC.2
MKVAFKQMQPITNRITGGVVNHLLVPNKDVLTSPAMYDKVITSLDFKHAQPYNILDDQDEVIFTLVKRNKLHLHQVFDTPFVRPDMQDCIGEYGTAEGAKEILEGTYDLNKFAHLPAMNHWIKNSL